MTGLTELTLVAAAEAVRRREISARELTQACLDRIEKQQPRLNCFTQVLADTALAAADTADTALASGAMPGPLHGVPLAHKDMFYRVSRPTTCGSKIRRDFRPDHTATVLERLDRAGAIEVGCLNMSEFAIGPTGHNVHFGDCRNAWNPDHISGGSSSGSGSATAGRTVFGALGSDTGGSIRLPAAANGVFGLKPTQTRVSRYGVMGLSFSLDTVGPLARTARDCARLFDVIAGADPRDATSAGRPVQPCEAATVAPDVRGLRIGVPQGYYTADMSAEVARLLEAARAAYSGLGAELVEVALPDPEPLTPLGNAIVASESATLHAKWLAERPDDYGPQQRGRLEIGLGISAVQYLAALQHRPRVVAEFCEAAFSRADLLMVPAVRVPLPTRAETDITARPDFITMVMGLTHCTRPFNYLGVPALSVPCGFTANGLPAAFQLVGRPFAEATLFRAAAAYEATVPWTRQPAPGPS